MAVSLAAAGLPDDQRTERLDTVDALLAALTGRAAELLALTATQAQASDRSAGRRGLRRNVRPAAPYDDVPDVLDHKRTETAAAKMLAFTAAPDAAGVDPPRGEAPDFLPVVLEFAATVDQKPDGGCSPSTGLPIDVLCKALTEMDSPYAHAVAAVCETLPAYRPGYPTRAAPRDGQSTC